MSVKRRIRSSSVMTSILVAGILAVPTVSFASSVTLKSTDGSVNMSGELVAFNENTYTIRTDTGELRVSAERVHCEGNGCPVIETGEVDLIIGGSDTVGEGMMPLLLQGMAAHQDADAVITATARRGEIVAELVGDQGFGDPMGKFQVTPSTSEEGFRKLGRGEIEIAMAERRVSPDEVKVLERAGAGNMVSAGQEHVIAVDSLIVIVHPNNPVQKLSVDQLAGIYSGTIRNWSQVGGPNAPISVFDRDLQSDSREVFSEVALGGKPLQGSHVEKVDTATAMANAVTSDENAIGFVGFAFQRGAKPVSLVNECGMTMTPDSFTARTEEYALQRRLYLYNRSRLSTEAQSLLDYATSPDADDIIQKAGFIDLGVDRRAQTFDSDRAASLLEPAKNLREANIMRDMLKKMVDFDRLSSTFRFNTGSSDLDERARLDMERLTTYLESLDKGTEVLLVGFTDQVGTFTNNYNLSLRRSATVLEQLQDYAGNRLDHVTMATTGYGELAPTACNISARGKEINRRVEVWVRES